MPGDSQTKKIFEIADDGMQSVLGYYYYVKACQELVEENEIVQKLPPRSIQITHQWSRYYSPDELCQAMKQFFEFYHARISLVSLISIFESALKNFIDRLLEIGKITSLPNNNYKARLKWAFEIASQSTYGNQEMIDMIPDLCINIDHARRIRNLWLHNNGLFNENYERDSINVEGRTPIIVDRYGEFLQNNKPTSFILKPEAFITCSLSHIELIHHLHDTIQRMYFGQQKSYEYKAEQKRIEWPRLLRGI